MMISFWPPSLRGSLEVSVTDTSFRMKSRCRLAVVGPSERLLRGLHPGHGVDALGGGALGTSSGVGGGVGDECGGNDSERGGVALAAARGAGCGSCSGGGGKWDVCECGDVVGARDGADGVERPGLDVHLRLRPLRLHSRHDCWSSRGSSSSFTFIATPSSVEPYFVVPNLSDPICMVS